MRRVASTSLRLEPIGDDKALLLEESAAEDSSSPQPAQSFAARLFRCFTRGRETGVPRTVELPSGRCSPQATYPRNVVRNAKFSLTSFFPLVMYQQFRFFFNLYFLLIALSQFVPALQIGFLFTYVSPLVFVLAVTLCKEAWDDIKRHMRDAEANSEKFERLAEEGPVAIPSRDISVGHLIVVRANQRVPADLILLRTSEQSGSSFLRTDQLDGETDWKLRRPLTFTQRLSNDRELFAMHLSIYAEAPKKDIYNFVGKATYANGREETVEPISVEQTAWAGTVVATGTVVGVVLYTGAETRAALNTSAPRSKDGVLEWELNSLSKVLFGVMLALSLLMVVMRGLHGAWPLQFFRYLILFSSIIPISLRVNLDMAKTVYTHQMMRDPQMPGLIARSSNIPEELGRVVYLLSDKTGTLTRNEMHFRRLHTGATSYTSSDEGLGELRSVIREEISRPASGRAPRRTTSSRALAALQAIAVTHSVTPGEGGAYHGTSPDEVALVGFAHDIGLSLVRRSQSEMVVRDPSGVESTWEVGITLIIVLASFPFSSTTKRMGIVLQQRMPDGVTGPATLFMKGADEVIGKMVEANDWLDEECSNLAREGLRTLVYARRVLSPGVWQAFQARYTKAKESMEDREGAVRAAVAVLEEGLELLAVTGVEDQLQPEVRSTLECLRHAGVKVWMLTGDKLETATCIGHSSGLVPSGLPLFTLKATSRVEASNQLNALSAQTDTALAVDGATLQILLRHLRADFIDAACKCSAVLACRCSPTQKAELVELVRQHTGARVCAVGDGGNDVSMIQASDVGLGLVGREGAQASLAADFSLTEFRHIRRLLLWHGRNSYKRSARLAQFVFHRGLIISWVQAVFSAIYYFAAISIYTGWLMVGYTTAYTMAPVFSLVLDEDVRQELVFRYPELYHELQKGRALSYRTFFIWMLKSIYQGGSIMLLAILLFESSFQNIVAITFTALVLCELLNVAFEVHHWHLYMVIAEIITVALYFGSILVLRTYFDASFVLTWAFAWRVLLLTAVSSLPVYISKVLQHRLEPSAGSKLTKEEEEL